MTTNTTRLLGIMATLRDPARGCPWDIEQTFATIAPHTIEEAYEVADAIDRGDFSGLRDELGDLLFQVAFHSQMAKEAGLFDFDQVAEAICDKMVRRHPHVFGDAVVRDAEAQTRAWEEHKADERRRASAETGGEPSALDGVSIALPALTHAAKLQKRAARVGFDWLEAALVLDKIDEEIAELRAELAANAGYDPARWRRRLKDEVGDLLFAVTNLARKLGIDGETALRHGSRKFERRFRHMERMARRDGRELAGMALAEQEALWLRAKHEIKDES